MELANAADGYQVRVAVNEDARAITRLLRRTPYSHVHVDWRLPLDWIGSPGFVVLPEPEFGTEQRRSVAAKFLPYRKRLQGCLAVAASPLPAAWVRVASVAVADDPGAALAAMLTRVVPFLRETAVAELGWLVIREWPIEFLPDLGFYQANEIEMYEKDDAWLPEVTAVPHLEIRPAQLNDMDALEQLEAEAFVPLWRYSADTLALAARQALSFDVAALADRVVGFQLSSRAGKGAHLVRLTISPDLHGQGIGSALLAHTIRGYHQQGFRQISLNTQVDNIESHRLYRKFGFIASGQRLPVWTLPIKDRG